MFKPILAALVIGIGAVVVAPAAIASASTQDFSFDSYSADYYLGLDSQGRTTLKTVETLVAEFPQYDQNHGILRLIPDSYHGLPTDVHVTSVTDGNGNRRPFREANDNERKTVKDFYQLVSRDANYVHGKETYVITYTQHNVTRFFQDTGDDEFYWDTNGTGWQQPFGAVSARVHVSPALAKAYNQQAACYQGYEGSTETCAYTITKGSNGRLTMTASAKDLTAGENVTVALGFRPGTIAPRDNSFFASSLGGALIFFAVLAVLALLWVVLLRQTVLKDARGRIAVIAQYTPPPGYDLLSAAVFLKRQTRASAAQIVDLAVRGNLRIVEGTAGFFNHKTYTLEYLNDTGLQDAERGFAEIFFGVLTPGAQYTISKTDTSRSRAVYALVQTVTGVLGRHVYRKLRFGARILPFLVADLAAIGAVICTIGMILDVRGGFAPVIIAAGVVVVTLISWKVLFRRPYNTAGAEYRDDLAGLELYIRLAEADRLRVLQSPSGAETTRVSTSDPRQIVKLNEKLLPYAVLFRLEKEWAEEIGKYYDGSSPDWYSGTGTFNAGLFAASISSFSSSTSASFSGSSSSSSSGGSGGGGSSGGGGGGGGGGGV